MLSPPSLPSKRSSYQGVTLTAVYLVASDSTTHILPTEAKFGKYLARSENLAAFASKQQAVDLNSASAGTQKCRNQFQLPCWLEPSRPSCDNSHFQMAIETVKFNFHCQVILRYFK
jgi:hypothetical protein